METIIFILLYIYFTYHITCIFKKKIKFVILLSFTFMLTIKDYLTKGFEINYGELLSLFKSSGKVCLCKWQYLANYSCQ